MTWNKSGWTAEKGRGILSALFLFFVL